MDFERILQTYDDPIINEELNYFFDEDFRLLSKVC